MANDGIFDCDEGSHTLNIGYREDGARVRNLRIVPQGVSVWETEGCELLPCGGNTLPEDDVVCEAAGMRLVSADIMRDPEDAFGSCCEGYCGGNTNPLNDFDCASTRQVLVEGAGAIEQQDGTGSESNRGLCCEDTCTDHSGSESWSDSILESCSMCQNTDPTDDFDCEAANARARPTGVSLLTSASDGASSCCLCPVNTFWEGEVCSPCGEGTKSDGGDVTACIPVKTTPILQQVSWQIIDGKMTRTYLLSVLVSFMAYSCTLCGEFHVTVGPTAI